MNSKSEIKLEDLKNMVKVRNYSFKEPKNNKLLIGCGNCWNIVVGVVIGLLINKKRHKNK